jgi:hypothetical protein
MTTVKVCHPQNKWSRWFRQIGILAASPFPLEEHSPFLPLVFDWWKSESHNNDMPACKMECGDIAPPYMVV